MSRNSSRPCTASGRITTSAARFPMARRAGASNSWIAPRRGRSRSSLVVRPSCSRGSARSCSATCSHAEAHSSRASHGTTQRNTVTLPLHFGQDPAGCMSFVRTWRWLTWIVGRPADSAEPRAARRSPIRASSITSTTHAYVDLVHAVPAAFLARDVPATEKQANALMALSKEQALCRCAGAWAAIFGGWALGARRGEPAGGHCADSQRARRLRATSGQDSLPSPAISRCWRKTCAPCGQIEAGLEALAEALALVDEHRRAAGGRRRCIASRASCCTRYRDKATMKPKRSSRQRIAIARQSGREVARAARAPCRWPGYWRDRGRAAPRRATCSRRSTAGSPRVSTRRTSKKPRLFSTS